MPVTRNVRRLMAAAVLSALAAFARPSEAVIVERVVAVIGERAILLTDLRKRARPALVQIQMQIPDPARRAAQETQLYHDLLNKMIDERLEEQAADKAHVTVTSDEIDRAMRRQAEQQNLSLKDFIAAAKRQLGMSEQDFRDEMRRQVLQVKLIQLRVMPRVRVTEEDAKAAYERWVKEVGNDKTVELQILPMSIPNDATEQQRKEREDLAVDIVKRGRSGEDFCKLVEENASNLEARKNCGATGQALIGNLQPILQAPARELKQGEISEPIPVGTEGIIIVKMAKVSGVPPYEQVRENMRQEATEEVVRRQHKAWLQDLRKGVYIDVRL